VKDRNSKFETRNSLKPNSEFGHLRFTSGGDQTVCGSNSASRISNFEFRVSNFEFRVMKVVINAVSAKAGGSPVGNSASGPAPTRAWRYFVVAIGAAALAIAVGFPGGSESSDSGAYILLAQGHVESVIHPFSTRQLEPLLVRALSSLMRTDVDRGFAVVAVLSTFVCVAGAGYIFYRESVPVLLFAGTSLLPVWASFDHPYQMPEIFYSALLTLFLLCLWRRCYWLGAAMLFPLYITRETTLAVLLCLLVAGIGILRPRVMAAAAGAAGAGALVAGYLARASPPNRHHLPGIVYLLGKVPYNATKNLFGVQIWTNTLNLNEPPLWIWHVPHWFHLGGIRLIGICPFHGTILGWTFVSWMSGFGVLPLLLYVSFRQGHLRPAWENLCLRFCLLYGVASFAAGPLLGAGVYRLVLYGWPAFLLAMPLVSRRRLPKERVIIAANLLCGWAPALIALFKLPGLEDPSVYLFVVLTVLVVCWLFTYREIGLGAALGADRA